MVNIELTQLQAGVLMNYLDVDRDSFDDFCKDNDLDSLVIYEALQKASDDEWYLQV